MFPGAARTNDHEPSSRNLVAHHSGGQKSEVKLRRAGVSEGSEGESLPGRSLPIILGVPWLVDPSFQPLLLRDRIHSILLYVRVCVHICLL